MTLSSIFAFVLATVASQHRVSSPSAPAGWGARTIHRITSELKGYRFDRSIAGPDPYARIQLYRKGDALRIVAWSIRPGSVAIELPGRFRLGNGQVASRFVLGRDPAFLVPERSNRQVRLLASLPSLPETATIASEEDAFMLVRRALRFSAQQAARPGKFTVDDTTVGGGLVESFHASGSLSELAPSPQFDQRMRSVARQLVALRDIGSVPRRFAVSYRFAGYDAIDQSTILVPNKPVRVYALPVLGNEMRVRIDNPKGREMFGRLTLRYMPARPEDEVPEPLHTLFRLTAAQQTLELAIPNVDAKKVAEGFALNVYGSTPLHPTADAEEDNLPNLFGTGIVQMVEWAPSLQTENFVGVVDGDSKIPGTARASVAPAPQGLGGVSEAIKLDYSFAPGRRFAILLAKGDLAKPVYGKPTRFGGYVFGDRSRNLLSVRFVDATGQAFQSDFGPLTFSGWRFVSGELDRATAHWGGANDGIVHYPIRIVAPVVVDLRNRLGGQRTLYFAKPTLTRRRG